MWLVNKRHLGQIPPIVTPTSWTRSHSFLLVDNLGLSAFLLVCYSLFFINCTLSLLITFRTVVTTILLIFFG